MRPASPSPRRKPEKERSPSIIRSRSGGIGVTGTSAANRVAREADLVIGIGTRWTDFTTASKSAFQDPKVRFINVNVAEFDAHKHAGLALVGDARATIVALAGWAHVVEPSYREKVERLDPRVVRGGRSPVLARARAAPRTERGHRRGQ